MHMMGKTFGGFSGVLDPGVLFLFRVCQQVGVGL